MYMHLFLILIPVIIQYISEARSMLFVIVPFCDTGIRLQYTACLETLQTIQGTFDVICTFSLLKFSLSFIIS